MRDLHPNGPITYPYSQPGRVSNPASGGGGGNATTATIDFGTGKGDTSATVAVTGQSWVTSSSAIVVTVIGTRAEDAAVEGLSFAVGSVVDGDGFTIHGASPFGSVGSYVVACVGV